MLETVLLHFASEWRWIKYQERGQARICDKWWITRSREGLDLQCTSPSSEHSKHWDVTQMLWEYGRILHWNKLKIWDMWDVFINKYSFIEHHTLPKQKCVGSMGRPLYLKIHWLRTQTFNSKEKPAGCKSSEVNETRENTVSAGKKFPHCKKIPWVGNS